MKKNHRYDEYDDLFMSMQLYIMVQCNYFLSKKKKRLQITKEKVLRALILCTIKT